MQKTKKLHFIGNAHIDPVWLWRWQEGFQEVKASFRSALDRMKEYPDFKFTSSPSIFYEWIEKNNPAMFKEIQQRVAEGRWEIAGGWVIEPDCNIPGGEAFARQGLYGQRYFKEKFGKIATTGYNVDSFGHTGSLPQILTKSGLQNYVFMRPMPQEKYLPSRVFWWEADDGSKILTYRIPYEYLTHGDEIAKYVNRIKGEFLDNAETLSLFYGVGNHGGGPTKAAIEKIIALDEEGYEFQMSTTEEFFVELRKSGMSYPTVHDDLQHHASGCYSVHSQIKKYNRISENSLLTAEKLSSIAKIVKNQPYPDDFGRAWKNVLFNQFHDIIAGTSLVSAYEDARNAHGESIHIAETNTNYAAQAISWDINIPQEDNMYPIVAFNPHSWSGPMVCETEVRGARDGKIKLVDDEGNIVRAQLAQSESVTGQRRLIFVADMPSMGYRTYRLYVQQETMPDFSPVQATNTVLESKNLKIEFNEASGFIKSFYDKNLGIEFLKNEGARLTVIEDKSDTWSHDVLKFDKELGNMKPLYTRLVENGPVRSTVRVKYQYNDSYVWQDFRLYHSLDYLEVKVKVDWREPLTMLKIKFPLKLNFRKPTYEIPFGHIERSTNGEEEPGQSWLDFSGESPGAVITTGLASGEGSGSGMAGLSLANTAKYSYSVDVNEMALTVLKNSPYAHHVPAELDPDLEYEYVESGTDSFSYALYPHAGSWKQGRIIQIAQELNVRPVIIPETYHPGDLPMAKSFLSVDKPQVVISAVKESEDRDGIIIRAYEAFKQHVDTVIDVGFMNKKINAHFNPCEIKTFKIPYAIDGEITETNLLEW